MVLGDHLKAGSSGMDTTWCAGENELLRHYVTSLRP